MYISKLAGEMYAGTSKSLPRYVKIGSSRASSVPNVAEMIQGNTTPSSSDDINLKSAEV